MNVKQQPFYKQRKLLGQGSFGKAYLVENTSDGVSFIFKTLYNRA